MKKLFFLCLMCLLVQTGVAQTSTWIDFQNTYGLKTGYDPVLMNWNFHQYKSGWGVWNFNGISPKSAEALVGPMYGKNIGKLYLEGGFGVGIEFNKKPLRGTGYIFGEHTKYWFLLDAEYGGSGEWYLGFWEYKFKPEHGLRLGIHAQEFAPHGLRVGYRFKNLPIYLYSVEGYDPQNKQPSFLFSIRYVPK